MIRPDICVLYSKFNNKLRASPCIQLIEGLMQSPRREARNDENWDPVHLTRYHHPRVGFSAPANDCPLRLTFALRMEGLGAYRTFCFCYGQSKFNPVRVLFLRISPSPRCPFLEHELLKVSPRVHVLCPHRAAIWERRAEACVPSILNEDIVSVGSQA